MVIDGINIEMYDFNGNLIKCSASDNIEDVMKEWKPLFHFKGDGACICNKSIKNISVMFNIKTKKCIYVGGVCYKKFHNIKSNFSKNLSKLINIGDGAYMKIEDLELYMKNCTSKVINMIENNIGKNNNLDELKKQKDIIVDLIEVYGLEGLDDILVHLEQTILFIEKEKEQREKLRNKKIQATNERYRRYAQEQYKMNREREEKEKLDNEKKQEELRIKKKKQDELRIKKKKQDELRIKKRKQERQERQERYKKYECIGTPIMLKSQEDETNKKKYIVLDSEFYDNGVKVGKLNINPKTKQYDTENPIWYKVNKN